MVLSSSGGGGNLKVLIALVDMLSCIRTVFHTFNCSKYRVLLKPEEWPHFAKIMGIRWVFE